MARTIIEYKGKRYQIQKSPKPLMKCWGCDLLSDQQCDFPCLEYDVITKSFHILKEIKQ